MHHRAPMSQRQGTRIVLAVLNSLASGKFEWNFRHVIFKQILMIDGWCISCEIALIWMTLDFTYDQSTLVQVMAWCRQATSHYLSQCWPRSMPPNGVTRSQWVNILQGDMPYWNQQIVEWALDSIFSFQSLHHSVALRLTFPIHNFNVRLRLLVVRHQLFWRNVSLRHLGDTQGQFLGAETEEKW